MTKNTKTPEFIFESSWEVCNKIGGIYTVLSTRAKTMQNMMHDRVVFIGPDHWEGKENPLFKEDRKILKTWAVKAKSEGLKVRTGRWNIPGEPIVVLVDFKEYFEKRNELYGELWEIAGIDSTKGYGDYDEANMFSYAASLVVESIYRNQLKKKIQEYRLPGSRMDVLPWCDVHTEICSGDSYSLYNSCNYHRTQYCRQQQTSV